jgi:hypothetical protein
MKKKLIFVFYPGPNHFFFFFFFFFRPSQQRIVALAARELTATRELVRLEGEWVVYELEFQAPAAAGRRKKRDAPDPAPPVLAAPGDVLADAEDARMSLGTLRMGPALPADVTARITRLESVLDSVTETITVWKELDEMAMRGGCFLGLINQLC